MVQSMSLSGNRIDEGEFYRFAISEIHDFHMEVDLPPEDKATVTPVAITTDELFQKTYFTWDTDKFVHRVGLASTSLDNEKSYLWNYKDSFNLQIREYIETHEDDFYSGEIDCDELQECVFQGTEIVCRQDYMVLDELGEIELPILTTYMYVGATRFAIRSIPVIDSDFWLLTPLLFDKEQINNRGDVQKAISEWKAHSDDLLSEISSEIKDILKSIWVQEGPHHINRMTYMEYEDPLLTILMDHVASHIAIVNYNGDLIFYVVKNKAYCVERLQQYRRWGAVLTAYTITYDNGMVMSIPKFSDNATIFSMEGVKLSFVANKMYKVRAQMLTSLFT